MKIYTRTGDHGETGLYDGRRVPKSDLRVDAYGDVDELNACIGLVLALGVDDEIGVMLLAVQRHLFAVGGRLADPDHRVAARVQKMDVGASETAQLEGYIDQLEEELEPLRRFILPGGSSAAAALHQARAVCRRAERRVVAIGPAQVPAELLAYLNRLSDFLFVVARAVNRRAGVTELEW